MVDVIELQNYIIENPTNIECILTELGHTNIKDKGKYYSACNLGGDNPSGLSILKSTLHCESYSRGWSTNLVGLVEEEMSVSFKESLQMIAGWIGFKGSNYKQKNIVLPFNGFFKQLDINNPSNYMDIPTYSNDILPPAGAIPQLWIKDGCSPLELEHYGITMDFNSNKIVIPARRIDGELVGAKARLNSNSIALDQRWSMYKPYSKSYVLWGSSENYNNIINKRTIIVSESEKSVIQCASMNLNCCTAIGGHNISDTQANLIKSFFADRIIVAFDEGISEEEIIWNCEKLKGNILYHPKISYIYDKDNIILKNKQSPFDYGRQVLQILLQKPFLHDL